jgi:hypothetical protein
LISLLERTRMTVECALIGMTERVEVHPQRGMSGCFCVASMHSELGCSRPPGEAGEAAKGSPPPWIAMSGDFGSAGSFSWRLC